MDQTIIINQTDSYISELEAYGYMKECLNQIPFFHAKNCSILPYDQNWEWTVGILNKLIAKITQDTGKTVIATLCTFYQDGTNFSDQEIEYDCDIFILILGATRICNINPITEFGVQSTIKISNGDLLFFNKLASKHYQINIPISDTIDPTIKIVFFTE